MYQDKTLKVKWMKKIVTLNLDVCRGYDSPGQGSYEGYGLSLSNWGTKRVPSWSASFSLEFEDNDDSGHRVVAYTRNKADPQKAVTALEKRLQIMVKKVNKYMLSNRKKN